MKSITILIFTLLACICFASENEKQVTPILTEPIEIVLVCPEGSKYAGEVLPKWVTTEEATDFYCNESVDETEIAE